MNLDDLLARLERVQKRQGYFMSRCPSHEDKQASLSIKEADDGKILIRCHAGCRFEDICSALDIRPGELSGNGETTTPASGEPESVYSYVDENGVELFQAVRFPGKKFRQRHLVDGEWAYNLNGVRRVLYRLPEVIAQAQKAGTVYVVEGEKDVESLRADGKVATCNPMGAGKWTDEYSEFLRGAKVIIVRDKDEPGRNHADAVKKSLAGKAKEIHLVQAKRGKDFTDHIEAGFKTDELVPVRDRRMTSIVTSSEMADRAIKALEQTQQEASLYTNPLGIPGMDFFPGRLYVGGGWTSDGKSVVCAQVYRHLSEGGFSVCYVTNEMSEEDLRNRLLCHKGFNLRHLERPWEMPETEKKRLVAEVESTFRKWDSEIVFDTTADHKKVADYLDDGAYNVLIFDHLHRIDSAGDETAIAREIRGFKNLALNYQIPVLLISQLRRAERNLPRPTVVDFKGSGAIEQEADLAFYVWRKRDGGGLPQGNQAELGILKHRHGERDVRHDLIFHGAESRFEKGVPTVEPVETVWG